MKFVHHAIALAAYFKERKNVTSWQGAWKEGIEGLEEQKFQNPKMSNYVYTYAWMLASADIILYTFHYERILGPTV